MVVLRIVDGAKRHFYYRLSEWVLTLTLASFSMKLLAPDCTFCSSPAYRVMASWGTEEQWGWFIAFFVLLRLTALVVNGTFDSFAPYSPLVRCVCSGLFIPVWFVIGLGFYQANPAGVSWAEHFVWMFGEAAVAYSVSRDAALALKTGGKGGRAT